MASYDLTSGKTGRTYKVDFANDPTPEDVDFAIDYFDNQPVAEEQPGYLSQLGTALSTGTQSALASGRASFNALTGDVEDTATALADLAAAQREAQAAQTPEDIAFMADLQRQAEELKAAEGVIPTIKEAIDLPLAALRQPGAALKTAVQSLPNALISTPVTLGAGLAGAAAGGLVGLPTTGPGALVTGAAGAVTGGALANAALEIGYATLDVLNERTNGASANWTREQILEALKADPTIIEEGRNIGATRGAVIGATEAAGLGLGGRIAGASGRAVAQATRQALVREGVDLADAAAVRAALGTPAVKAAQEAARAQFTVAGDVARAAAGAGVEVASSGAGEALAQMATGQEVQPAEVFLEMLGEGVAAPGSVLASTMAQRVPLPQVEATAANLQRTEDAMGEAFPNVDELEAQVGREAADAVAQAVVDAGKPMGQPTDLQSGLTDLGTVEGDLLQLVPQQPVSEPTPITPVEPLPAVEAEAPPAVETQTQPEPQPRDEIQIAEAGGLPPVESQPVVQAPAGQAPEGAALGGREGQEGQVTAEPVQPLPAAPAVSELPAPQAEVVSPEGGAATEDWLSAIFAEPAPQAQAAQTPEPAPVALADQLDAFAAQMEASAQELASRQYKRGRGQVELRGDGPSRKGSMSFTEINESRRARGLAQFAEQSRRAQELSRAIRNGEVFSDQLRRVAEEARRLASEEMALRARNIGPQTDQPSQRSLEEGFVSRLLLGDTRRTTGPLPGLILDTFPPTGGVPTESLPAGQPTSGDVGTALRAVATNTATPEQVASLEAQGLARTVQGQPVITDAGLAQMPEAERPRLTEAERVAEIEGQGGIMASLRDTDAAYTAALQGDNGNDDLQVQIKAAPKSARQKVLNDWVARNPQSAAELQRLVDEAARAAGKIKFLRRFVDPSDIISRSGHRKTWSNVASRIFGERIHPSEIPVIVGRYIKNSDFPESLRDILIVAETSRKLSREEDMAGNNILDIITSEYETGEIDPVTGINSATFDLEMAFRNSLRSANLKRAEALSRIKDKTKNLYEDREIINLASSLPTTSDIEAEDNSIVFRNKDSAPFESADPITIDDSGNVIPLSQRFQPESPDIRFSIRNTPPPNVQPSIRPLQGDQQRNETLARRKRPRPSSPTVLRARDGQPLPNIAVTADNAAKARDKESRQVPGASETWIGTTEQFLAEFADTDAGRAVEGNSAIEAFYDSATDRAVVLTDRVQVREGDARRAVRNGTSAAEEAVRRLIRHESFVHRGWRALPSDLRSQFLALADAVVSAEDLDTLAKTYRRYANWRDDPSVKALAFEEWLAQRIERIEKLPAAADGPLAQVKEWLGRVWQWLTGDDSLEATPTELGQVMRQMVRALETGEKEMAADAVMASLTDTDAAYMDAVARGDMETAQRLVDEAARAAGSYAPFAATKAAVSDTNTGAYHYGDGGIGRDTVLKRMSPSRGTGHFGTGTYFFGKRQPSTRGGRPEVFLELAGLNLAKPKSPEDLHSGLKGVNRIVLRGEAIDLKNASSDYSKTVSKLWFGLNSTISKEIISDTIEKVRLIFDSKNNDLLRTPSTYFMQLLGFDGIDVRDTDLDNGDYGSVIYPPLFDSYWYHGKSPDLITVFDISKAGANTGDGGGGVWLSSNLKTSETYRNFTGSQVPFYKLDNLDKIVSELKSNNRYLVPAKNIDLAVDEDSDGDVYFNNRGKWEFVGNLNKPFSIQQGAKKFGFTFYTQADLVLKSHVFSKNPLIIEEDGKLKTKPWGDIVRFAKNQGHDAVIFANTVDTRGSLSREFGNRFIGHSIVVFSPNQIKSADPVTYDDAGNVIPLSQRFQPESPDIRFSLAQDPNADTLRRIVSEASEGPEATSQAQPFAPGVTPDMPLQQLADGRMAEANLKYGVAEQKLQREKAVEFIDAMGPIGDWGRKLLSPEWRASNELDLSSALGQYVLTEALLRTQGRMNDVTTDGIAAKRSNAIIAGLFSGAGTNQAQGLNARMNIQRDPRYAALFVVQAATDMTNKTAATVVDPQVNVPAATDAVAQGDEQARQQATDDLAEELRLRDLIYDMGIAAQDAGIAERIRRINDNVFRLGVIERMRAAMAASGVAPSMVTASRAAVEQQYEGFTLEQLEAEASRLRDEIRQDVAAVEQAAKAKPKTARKGDDPVTQAKALIDKLEAGPQVKKSPKPNPVRDLYRQHLKEPMAAGDFVGALTAIGVGQVDAQKLYDLAAVKIAAAQATNTQAKLSRYLSNEGSALASAVNAIRSKTDGAPTWAQLFNQPFETQRQWRQRFYEALRADPALANLTPQETRDLAAALDKVWNDKRERNLQSILSRANLPGAKPKTKQKIAESVPLLLRYLNTGVFNDDSFRAAVAKKFGAKVLGADDLARISTLAQEAQAEGITQPERNQKLFEMVKIIQQGAGVEMGEVISNYWVTAVLSGFRTQFDMALSSLNGLRVMAQTAADVAIRRRDFKMVGEAAKNYFKTMANAILESANYFVTGDPTLLDGYQYTMNTFLQEGIAASNPFDFFEQVIKDPRRGPWSKVIPYFFAGIQRAMRIWDHINSTAVKEGMLPLAIALNPEKYKDARMPSAEDVAQARQKALSIVGGDKTYREKRAVSAYTRQILNDVLGSQYPGLLEEAREVGFIAAYQNDPTGLGGIIYHTLLGVTKKMVSAAGKFRDEGVAQREQSEWSEARKATDKFVRGALYILASNARNFTGTRFVRFVGNRVNELLSFTPIVGLARLAEKDMTASKRSMIYTNQLVGGVISLWVISSMIRAMEDEEDEDKRGWNVEGSWANLTPQQKNQRRAEGRIPYSLKIGGVNFNYNAWPMASLFATVGNLYDMKRYRPDKWNEKEVLDKTLSALWAGGTSFMDLSSISGLMDMLGRSAYSTDPVEGAKQWAAKTSANYVGGFIPRALKDLDSVFDPEMRKPDNLFGYFAKEIPYFRRMEAAGEKLYDVFGEPVQVRREPWSRSFSQDKLEPEYQLLGDLNERGIFLSPANPDARTVGSGVNRRELSKEEAEAYMMETGKLYKDYVLAQGERLKELDFETAKAKVSKDTERLRNAALRRAISTTAQ